MDRTGLINYLIHQRNAKRYLEISAHEEKNNFARINCTNKVTTFPHTSDKFFRHKAVEKNKRYDIIFIDGIHTEENVLSDIAYAKLNLSDSGIIILHDCMPPDAWHQRDQSGYKPGENWNGSVWKVALQEFNVSTSKCTLVDIDWGCGVIDTAHTQVPVLRKLPPQLVYDLHYPWLLEYKMSLADYVRSCVKVFYHLACMGNWEEVFKEQILQLHQNGFQQLDLTVLGTPDELTIAERACEEAGLKANIIFHSPELNYFERPALIAVEKYAKLHEGYVLYLHSKGVSSPADHNKTKWRRLMMHELIERWEDCIPQLPYYDAIGVNWREMYPVSHFCGNFWYASTKYLRKLKDFSSYFDNPRFKIYDRVDNKRLGCEFWISSADVTPKVLSLYCKNVDFCRQEFWRNK